MLNLKSIRQLRCLQTRFRYGGACIVMAMALHLAHLMVLGAGEAASRPSIGARRQTLERLAREIQWLPHNLMGGLSARIRYGTDVENNKAQRQVTDLRMLIKNVDALPTSLLGVKDPTQRGLAAWVFGLSDSPKKVSAAVKCLNDNADTTIAGIPYNTPMYGLPRKEDRKELTVADLARLAMIRRLVSFSFFAEFPFTSNADAARYWEDIEDTDVLPSEWVYRFKRESRWGGSIAATKKELPKRVKPSHVGIIIASVRAFVPNAYTDKEVIQALIKSGNRTLLRGILEQTLQRPGISLKNGPNSKHQREVRHILLRVAPKVLLKDDAQWVYDAAPKPSEWLSTHYIVAAAKLDPDKGVGWLRKALVKDRDQLARCRMLEALWPVGGESQISYIKDRYFAEKKPEYNAGGLQEDLIEELGKNEGGKAAGLLKAFILDNRFTTLGWAATRAFAKNGKIILGQETKEVKRYLSVQHRMGVDSFERQLDEREKYLVDTKHVLMQTEAFQIYLQGEVLKRSQMNNDQK